MNKIFLTIIIVILSYTTGLSQVIEFQKKTESKLSGDDTLIALTYFNKVDDVLLQKLDSFNLFLSQQKYELDSSFYYEIRFLKLKNKQTITICYQSQYHDYLMISNSLKITKQKSPFAFFFYKNRLVICSVFSKTLDLTKESKALLKNLIYEHVGETEKAFIRNPPNAIIVETKPVKAYNLE